jgi:Flp pilus assembly pilin Flp
MRHLAVLGRYDNSATAGCRARDTRREVTQVLKLAACVQTFLCRFDREEGQTMAEYAVILSVITAAVLLVLGVLSGNISTVLNRIADAIN